MSDLDAEQLDDEEFQAQIRDADRVLLAQRRFHEVMPQLVDRLFDPEAQKQAVEYLTSPLLTDATSAFSRRWSRVGDAA